MVFARAQRREVSTLSNERFYFSSQSLSSRNGKVSTSVKQQQHAMDTDNSATQDNSASNHVNGMSNGYSSSPDKHHHKKSEHKDKHRDKDKHHSSRDHKSSSSSHRDKDKERSKHHHSSSHKSSSSSKDKDRHRDKDRDKDKEKKSSSSSSSKDHHKSSSSKDHHSKDHKSSRSDKDRHHDKEKKDKDRHRDKHSSSSSSKHKDKHRSRDKDKHGSSSSSYKEIKREPSEEKKVKNEIKEEPEYSHNGNGDYLDDDDKKLVIKEENNSIKEEDSDSDYRGMNSSQASSCDYNMSQFKEESKFDGMNDEEDQEEEQEQEEEEEPEEESEEEVKPKRKSGSKRKLDSDEEEYTTPSTRKKAKKSSNKKRAVESDEEEEDVKPKKKEKKEKKVKEVKPEPTSPKKRKKKEEESQEVWKWWEEEKKEDGTKWKYLEHKGPVFAPPYERIPSNVKFMYNGEEMTLSQDAEEIAGFYAKMLDHDYTTKDIFNNNFFKDWRKSMTDKERKIITDLKKCNFKKMHAYFMDIAEKNRNRTKEEKQALKEKNEEIMKEYGFCTIDGHKEKIGNFKIEPPGLFRGRGEHPKMGMLKKRVMPEDVLINCSKDSKIPKPPPGHKWKEVRHDPTVTWLASWTENVQNQVKYVMLNPSSKLKGEKDWQKYETARRLHKCIDKIRNEYREDWKSKEMRIRQRAVALYFIDKLALRAGNEKDEDQADTVGCCSLRVEHIQLHEHKDGKDYVVVFDFLGKDSIRYYNEVPVEKRVFKNLQLFMENKSAGDDLFDRLNTTVMNKHLMELMDGLTAKVFRTYNASFTLQQQLDKLTNAEDSLSEKILSYNRANRAVAILCNHQRAVPKGHQKSMEKLKEKIEAKREQISDAERAVKDAHKDAKRGSVKEKQIYEKKKKQLDRLKEQLTKLEIQETDRDENKTIALGTSKLNYLDPRISVAWCKKYDVPIEKIYNKTQRDKFRWAIDMAGPDYVF